MATAGTLALATPASADPNGGANATPGYLFCGDNAYQITSGSELANAIQLVDDTRTFVVQSIPEWDFYIALGVSEEQILTCVLDEPAIGYPIVVTGTLTDVKARSRVGTTAKTGR